MAKLWSKTPTALNALVSSKQIHFKQIIPHWHIDQKKLAEITATILQLIPKL